MNNMNTLTNSQIKCMAEGSKQYTHDDVTVIASRLIAAEAQLAELRGQVPFGYASRKAIFGMFDGKTRFTSVFPIPTRGYVIPVYIDPAPPAASQPNQHRI